MDAMANKLTVYIDRKLLYYKCDKTLLTVLIVKYFGQIICQKKQKKPKKPLLSTARLANI